MEPTLKSIRAKLSHEEFAALKNKVCLDGFYLTSNVTLIVTGCILFLAAQLKELGVFIFSDAKLKFAITVASVFLIYVGLILCMFPNVHVYFSD